MLKLRLALLIVTLSVLLAAIQCEARPAETHNDNEGTEEEAPSSLPVVVRQKRGLLLAKKALLLGLGGGLLAKKALLLGGAALGAKALLVGGGAAIGNQLYQKKLGYLGGGYGGNRYDVGYTHDYPVSNGNGCKHRRYVPPSYDSGYYGGNTGYHNENYDSGVGSRTYGVPQASPYQGWSNGQGGSYYR